MDQRSNLIWTFLIIVAVVVIGWEVYHTYAIAKRVGYYRRESAQTILGTDEQLSHTVNQLETTLSERHDYTVEMEKDPLDLSEVIRSQKILARLGFGDMDEDDEMRLSCTIVGETNSAVLKFGGRSHIVEVGDVVNGYHIVEISQKAMTMKRGGDVLTLENRKATSSWEEEESSDMPFIETTSPVGGKKGGNF